MTRRIILLRNKLVTKLILLKMVFTPVTPKDYLQLVRWTVRGEGLTDLNRAYFDWFNVMQESTRKAIAKETNYFDKEVAQSGWASTAADNFMLWALRTARKITQGFDKKSA